VSVADRLAMMARIRPYLAEDLSSEDTGLDDEDDQELDDAEIFVEVKTNRFLAALGLPPLPAAH
jgi:hypothetical protein